MALAYTFPSNWNTKFHGLSTIYIKKKTIYGMYIYLDDM